MKKTWPYIIIVISLVAIIVAFRRLYTFDLRGSLIVDPSQSYGRRSLDEVRYIVLHHSAIDGYGPEDYAQWHVEKNGWPGIGYHFVIQPGGTIYQVNDLETVSYHTKGNNTPAVGICLSGNLSEHEPTLAQESSLKRLIKKLKKELPESVSIHGHGEFVNTSCPGNLDVDKFR